MDREIEGVDVGDVLKTAQYPEATAHQHPGVVADIDSTFDPDPGFLRYDGPTRAAIELKIAEEESADVETSHSLETVGIFVGE